jgi:hypothetical protein
MKAQGVSKTAMAERMGTSRSQLDQLLVAENPDVQLATIARAVRAVGMRLRIGMERALDARSYDAMNHRSQWTQALSHPGGIRRFHLREQRADCVTTLHLAVAGDDPIVNPRP